MGSLSGLSWTSVLSTSANLSLSACSSATNAPTLFVDIYVNNSLKQSVLPTDTQAYVSSLSAATSYLVELACRNAYGSAARVAMSPSLLTMGTPSIVSIQQVTDASFLLFFSAPSTFGTTGTLAGYDVYSDEATSIIIASTSSSYSLPYIFINATRPAGQSVLYRLKVRNQYGQSSPSAAYNVTTLAPPSNLETSAVTSTTLRLSWAPPSIPGTNSSFSSVKVYEDSTLLTSLSASASSYSLSALTPGSCHLYRITAVNNWGSETPLSISPSLTTCTIGLPTILGISAVRSNQFTVSWAAPVQLANNSAISGYFLYVDGLYSSAVSSTTFTTVLSSPAWTAGSAQSVTVTANTTVAWSNPSASSPVTLQASPSALVASNVSSESFTLSFSPPSTAGIPNESLLGYNLYANGSFVQSLAATATSVVLSGLYPGSTTAYRLTALNGNGESAVSTALDLTTMGFSPIPSSSSQTPRSVAITWTPATTPGSGSTFTQILIYQNNVILQTMSDIGITSFNHTDLVPGTCYEYFVLYKNSWDFLTPLSGLPLTVCTPGVPSITSVSNMTSNSFNMTWIAPSLDVTAVVTEYNIFVNGMFIISTPPSARSLILQTALFIPGYSYSITMMAITNMSPTELSDAVQVTLHDAPCQLSVSSISSTSIVLHFIPAATAGTNAVRFGTVVFMDGIALADGLTGSLTVPIAPGLSSVLISNLTAASNHTFYVQDLSSVGLSSASNTIRIQTMGLPSALHFTSIMSVNASISWAPAVIPGTNSSFVAQRVYANGVLITQLPPFASCFNLTLLAPGMLYSLQLFAVNSWQFESYPPILLSFNTTAYVTSVLVSSISSYTLLSHWMPPSVIATNSSLLGYQLLVDGMEFNITDAISISHPIYLPINASEFEPGTGHLLQIAAITSYGINSPSPPTHFFTMPLPPPLSFSLSSATRFRITWPSITSSVLNHLPITDSSPQFPSLLRIFCNSTLMVELNALNSTHYDAYKLPPASKFELSARYVSRAGMESAPSVQSLMAATQIPTVTSVYPTQLTIINGTVQPISLIGLYFDPDMPPFSCSFTSPNGLLLTIPATWVSETLLTCPLDALISSLSLRPNATESLSLSLRSGNQTMPTVLESSNGEDPSGPLASSNAMGSLSLFSCDPAITCHGHGLCVPLTTTCACYPWEGYSGSYCSIPPVVADDGAAQLIWRWMSSAGGGTILACYFAFQAVIFVVARSLAVSHSKTYKGRPTAWSLWLFGGFGGAHRVYLASNLVHSLGLYFLFSLTFGFASLLWIYDAYLMLTGRLVRDAPVDVPQPKSEFDAMFGNKNSTFVLNNAFLPSAVSAAATSSSFINSFANNQNSAAAAAASSTSYGPKEVFHQTRPQASKLFFEKKFAPPSTARWAPTSVIKELDVGDRVRSALYNYEGMVNNMTDLKRLHLTQVDREFEVSRPEFLPLVHSTASSAASKWNVDRQAAVNSSELAPADVSVLNQLNSKLASSSCALPPLHQSLRRQDIPLPLPVASPSFFGGKQQDAIRGLFNPASAVAAAARAPLPPPPPSASLNQAAPQISSSIPVSPPPGLASTGSLSRLRQFLRLESSAPKPVLPPMPPSSFLLTQIQKEREVASSFSDSVRSFGPIATVPAAAAANSEFFGKLPPLPPAPPLPVSAHSSVFKKNIIRS